MSETRKTAHEKWIETLESNESGLEKLIEEWREQQEKLMRRIAHAETSLYDVRKALEVERLKGES
jgi:predicted ribosome quality control (RQC) complex YloA/Tae2 family protein